MKNKTGILDLTLSKRTDLVKFILAACILAMGTNLLANFLTDYFGSMMIVTLVIGGGLIILVLFYLVYSIILEAENEIEIEGLIVIDPKTNSVCSIPRYEFSEDLSVTMDAVFLENEALKKYWDIDFNKEKSKQNETDFVSKNGKPREQEKDGPKYVSIVRVVNNERNKEKKKADKLLEEIVEYLIIEELSTHLSDYFNSFNHQDKLIKEYTRNDFPEMLLQNRIVNLLSTPFEDRAIFSKAGMHKNPPEGEIVSIYGTDGSRYTKFDLVLPTGSTIIRPEEGVLIVENNRIFLQIEIYYSGFAANLPEGFEQYYLGIEKLGLETRSIEVILKYRIKPIALFYRSKWNYHNWVDSFAERLIGYTSFDSFIHNINWETSLTGIIAADHRGRNLMEKNQSENKK